MCEKRNRCSTMIAGLAAMIVLSMAPLLHTAKASHPISLTLVDIGDNITFECNASEKELKFLNWYKQSLGHMFEIVASVIVAKWSFSDKFKGSHFAITPKGSSYDLTIFNISKEDEATYLCHIGTAYSQKFINGTFLAVNDDKQQKSLYLKQHPKTELVRQGETVTLQCSLLSKNKEKSQCPTKPSMYWFRTESEQFHPGIIYTQRNISDKDLARSCSYTLSVRDSSDAGIYYSTVVACGSIVIGEGTKVDTIDSLVVTLGGLLVCCVIVIVLLILYIKLKQNCGHGKGQNGSSLVEDHKSEDAHTRNLDGEAIEANYATVQTRVRRTNEKKKSPQECVYSSVKSDGQYNQLSSL
ncbi:immunoglobulin kappa light chain-like isoform X1 [Poeciliopsis prolifica]|uniref:immunoglobulin kappa light chain-like isoform X1 n=1 Tax=Poeciliopsis prolifica TaxID=188132 RepID=UPI002413E80F|nr:immunoglobulin kappa light chain-like isoform X1 [Poeciliopsis prolifica]